MGKDDLARIYRAYIDCLNARDWDGLGRFVDAEAARNGHRLGVAGYRAMLENDVATIPDLRFTIALLAVDPPVVAARLAFDCTPGGDFLGLPVDGRRVTFTENVLYEFRDGKILRVWSLIDREAVADQLGRR